MSTSLITSALAANAVLSRQISVQAWAADEQTRGEKVALFRQYMDGDHRANLTTEMANLLRVDKNSLDQFNDNHCPRVVYTMTNRLQVTGIDSDNDSVDQWVADLLQANRFDGMQTDLHEAALRDGRAFVLVDFDNATQAVRLTLEPAYDGTAGIIPLYDETGRNLTLALKIWHITTQSGNSRDGQGNIANTMRLNAYYPDRIEKYIAPDGGNLTRYEEDGEAWPAPWKLAGGQPIGVPLVPFVNRATGYTPEGQSELENVIPLQDALNRTMYSMIMTSELTAFNVRFTYNFAVGAAITPGMVVEVTGIDKDSDYPPGIDQWQAGDLTAYIAVANWFKTEIATITDTPMPELMGGDTASGEALKQREAGLLGKLRRIQVKWGNSYEDMIRLAMAVQTAYGRPKPPAVGALNTRWQDVELRNESDVIADLKLMADYLDDETLLEELGRVMNWDADRIAQVLERKRSDSARRASTMLNGLPNFSNFTAGFDAGLVRPPGTAQAQTSNNNGGLTNG